MSGYASGLWSILSSYRPNAARNRQAQPLRFGAFEATYYPVGYAVRQPRTDREAQRLYNHIRTVAFWLDAAPLLSDLGLPFRAGLDDIISLVPLYGDIVAGVLQLYQVWLCFIFGVPLPILGYMFLNTIADVVVGIVPLIGDFLDNLFKSNLRNLALLESWLLTDPSAQRYHILIMPESNEFVPKPKSASRFSTNWFGGGSSSAEDAEKERERSTGKVRTTRRMGRNEGEQVPVGMGTRSKDRADAVHEPVD
ncbi:MAG: hypothetical protein TREMPRED_005090 [Tremellales sp. Tagirdzhanova-0007]|nr:MAG: hypothetical protein TREMPRED_005090 [Tremellales sp. Tagirdzhanova-0007]